jgi:hypothetical protein
MSYKELAQRLGETSQLILQQEERLQGDALASTAEKLQKALIDFRKRLDTELKANSPEVLEFQHLMQSDAVLRAISAEALKTVYKVLVGKALPAKKDMDPRAAFVQGIMKQGLTEEVMPRIRHLLTALEQPLLGNDEAAFRNELARIGGLSDEDWMLETATTLSPETLKALAGLLKMKTAAKTKPAALAKIIRPIAVSFYQNITY